MKSELRGTADFNKSRLTEDLSKQLWKRSKPSSVMIELSHRYCSPMNPKSDDKATDSFRLDGGTDRTDGFEVL